MRIEVAAQTDIGRRKRKNEDYYGVFQEDTPGITLFPEGALLVVADGLGGHLGGEIASKLAVSLVKDLMRQPPPPPPSEPGEDEAFLPIIKDAITRANDNIYKTNQDLIKSDRPMGTTLIVALVTPRKVYIGNVGDTRCYHLRDGEILTKTQDHSWVDEQVQLGLMSKSEAESDSRRNIVTRSVGTHPVVDIDTYTWHIVPGDMLLLCTDGLVNMCKDAEIIPEFRKNVSPAEIVPKLVAMANDNGGRDNITVVVADISPSISTVMRRRFKSFSRKRGAGILWFLLWLIWTALSMSFGYFLAVGFGDH